MMSTVLVIEDEPTILMLAESILQRAGYETLSAASVAQAQSIIHSDQTIDIVVSDINLVDQKEGGIQIGQMIRQSRAGTPVLYTSGTSLTDGMTSLFSEPSAFLPKPYTDGELLAGVAGLLRSSGKTNA